MSLVHYPILDEGFIGVFEKTCSLCIANKEEYCLCENYYNACVTMIEKFQKTDEYLNMDEEEKNKLNEFFRGFYKNSEKE